MDAYINRFPSLLEKIILEHGENFIIINSVKKFLRIFLNALILTHALTQNLNFYIFEE